MKVKDLKAKLEGLDDDMLVVREAFDHSYRPLWVVSEADAEFKSGEYHECWDNETMFDGKIIKVLVME